MGDTKSLDWINADRHTDTERNIQGFLSSLGDLVREGGGVCTVRQITGLQSFNAHALECIELVNFQCTAIYWTALPPYSALHCTALGEVFKSLDIVKYIYNFFALLF